MKIIEEFCKIMKDDIEKHGSVSHNSLYLIKLDKDDLIKDIEFASIPTEKYLMTCSEKERELIKRWLVFKLETMDKWKVLYNDSVMTYNDYCGKRAGEHDNMFNLVMDGYSIANVIPFKPVIKTKAIKENSL